MNCVYFRYFIHLLGYFMNQNKTEWFASQGIDMSAIINQQVGQTRIQTPEQTEISSQPIAIKSTENIAPTMNSLQESSLLDEGNSANPSSSIETIEKQWSIGGIDLQSMLQQAPEQTSFAEKKTYKKSGIIKLVAVTWILATGLFGAYFIATIVFPVELENARAYIQNIGSSLTASVLGKSTNNGSTENNSTDTKPEAIEYQTQTPIANSVAQEQKLTNASQKNTIAISDSSQKIRDTVLPENNNTEKTSSTSLQWNIGSSVRDLTTTTNSSFDDLEEAIGLSPSAVEKYIITLEKITIDVETRQASYTIKKDKRGIAITQTLLRRINELIAWLESEVNDESIATIEEDIAQLEKLLDAIDM